MMGRILKWDMTCEYRAWPDQDDALAATIRRHFQSRHREDRTDDYLLPVSRCSLSFLPKIRAGKKFEIKQKIRTEGAIEIWRRILSESFPLHPNAQRVLEAVYPGARFSGGALDTPGRLVGALMPNAFICRVRKTRLTFRKGACKAEITQIEALGKETLTVALECSKLAPLADYLQKQGSSLLPNIDYGTWLRAQLKRHHSLCTMQ
ncbi:MAG: hypothetical protein C0456_02930 [Hyphomonas sp.]|nr:hypothetical protein [Hyphomonas sp.]